MRPANRCDLPPRGWRCNLERGHGGPCPAYPSRSRFLWEALVETFGLTGAVLLLVIEVILIGQLGFLGWLIFFS